MAGANIKIGANSSEFQKQMKEVTTNLKLVSSECGVASEKAKLFGTASDKLGASQKELTSKLQAQNQIVKLYQDRIVGINNEIDKQKLKQTDLSKKIEETTNKHKEAVSATGKNSDESKKLQQELTKLKEDYAKNERAIDGSNQKLVEANVKMNNTEKAILKNQAALQSVDKEISNLKLDKLEQGLDKVSNASGKASDKLKPISAGIIGLGTASVTASVTFEDSMAKVMTIADQTQMSYGDMKKAIIDLSNETGISANTIADNVYEAISAGQSTGDAVNFVTESTKLAKAGFADAGQSLDLLTTILNSYGMEASEVNRVSDILVQTQNQGKVTVAQLASDMGKIIPTAKGVGVNLEQVSAGYALMTSNGIKSAETTTYMNSMLNELGGNGTKASDNLKELSGSSFQELIAGGKSVGDILAMMSKSAQESGLSITDMFGSQEGAKAAMILSTDAGGKFNEALVKMGQSAGATDTAFKTVNETTGNDFKRSLNEVKNSAISMGDTLAPVTSTIAGGLSNITSMLSKLSSEQLSTIAGIGMGIVTVNLSLGAFSKLTGGVRDGIKAFKDMKNFSAGAIKNLKDFGASALNGAKSAGNFAMSVGKNMVSATINGAKAAGSLALSIGRTTIAFAKNTVQLIAQKVASIASTIATNAMAIAQAALNFIMSLNPITLIIIAIVALVATIVLLWNKCEWFRNLCYALFEGLKIAWNVMCEVFKFAWNLVCEWFRIQFLAWKLVFETVVNAIKFVWDGICIAISFIWQTIVNIIINSWNGWKNIFQAVGDFISSVWNGITATIGSVWDGVVNGIMWAWQGITAPFKKVIDAIGGMWESVKSMFKLPHFSITGTLNPLKWSDEGLPKVNVDWYSKGGIFTSPTTFGGIGVGDAFNGQGSNAEAVIPLDSMYRNLRNIVREENNNTTGGESPKTLIAYIQIGEKQIQKVMVPLVAEGMQEMKILKSLATGGA
ncbi:MAG: phage tail tape measure protein [Clostridium sp.]